MNFLSVENLSIRFGELVLFENINFGLNQGDKVAIVGINGSGKSTLLKILAGLEEPGEGAFTFRNGIKVAYLSQKPEFDEQDTAYQAIFYSDHKDLVTLRNYQRLSSRASLSAEEQKEMEQLLIDMDAANLWDYDSQIRQILGKLGVTNLDQPVASMSGGQRKRVALARELIAKPDFLMLDEPTNHLDVEMIEWLEEYLSTANTTLLMITHDRYFLDRVTNHIIEIDRQQLFKYEGNYAAYLEQKAIREENEAVEVGKARNLMKKELDWIRRQPKARGTKAKYRIDAFHDLKDKASTDLSKKELELKQQYRRQGGKILEVDELGFGYDGRNIIQDFSYVFRKNERVGLVGPNGAGKSTFIKLLTTELPPRHGTVVAGQNTVFGHYRQEELSLPQDKKVIDVVKEVAEVFQAGDGSNLTASQFLNTFLFPPKRQYDFVYKLSGGEKRRLQLLMVLIKNPNFLILDEPTNDLDLVTLNVLEDYLENYQGCLMIVSHDRYFMDRLVDHLFILDGSGYVHDYNGNYTDYRLEKQQQEKKQPKAASREADIEKPKTDKRKPSFKEKQEYEALGKELEQLEAEKKSLQGYLSDGKGSSDDFAAWGKRLTEVDQMIDEKELRWLELSELIE